MAPSVHLHYDATLNGRENRLSPRTRLCPAHRSIPFPRAKIKTDMGGRNPYFDELASVEAPTQKFSITFLPMNVTIEVDPYRMPYGDTGLPGSILDVALAHGIDLDHACGGVCACSTCHCVVQEGGEVLSEMSDGEEDQLSFAPGLTPESRLACQGVANGMRNLIVYIPEWNRNAAREDH